MDNNDRARRELEFNNILKSPAELEQREDILRHFERCPIPKDELLSNLALFLNRQNLQQILFMDFLYRQVLNTHGIVMELGVRWGKNLALFESFRGIYEPYNHNRRIVGFDTFEGFPSLHSKDGDFPLDSKTTLSVTEGYEEYLSKILDYHEQQSPISHVKKYELVKGDAAVTIDKYLDDNPHTIIALAYFDFDLYEPTKKGLEAIRDHLTKGSIIGFDELNVEYWPGETLALKEVFGLDKYRIRHSPLSTVSAYIVIE